MTGIGLGALGIVVEMACGIWEANDGHAVD